MSEEWEIREKLEEVTENLLTEREIDLIITKMKDRKRRVTLSDKLIIEDTKEQQFSIVKINNMKMELIKYLKTPAFIDKTYTGYMITKDTVIFSSNHLQYIYSLKNDNATITHNDMSIYFVSHLDKDTNIFYNLVRLIDGTYSLEVYVPEDDKFEVRSLIMADKKYIRKLIVKNNIVYIVSGNILYEIDKKNNMNPILDTSKTSNYIFYKNFLIYLYIERYSTIIKILDLNTKSEYEKILDLRFDNSIIKVFNDILYIPIIDSDLYPPEIIEFNLNTKNIIQLLGEKRIEGNFSLHVINSRYAILINQEKFILYEISEKDSKLYKIKTVPYKTGSNHYSVESISESVFSINAGRENSLSSIYSITKDSEEKYKIKYIAKVSRNFVIMGKDSDEAKDLEDNINIPYIPINVKKIIIGLV